MIRVRQKIEAWFEDRRFARAFSTIAIIVGIIGVALAIRKVLSRNLDLYVLLSAANNVISGVDIYTTPHPTGALYLYLPLLAVLFIPLAMLPQWAAAVIWELAIAVLIAWSLHGSIRLIAGDRYGMLTTFERWALYILPVVFCLDAISSEFGNGQVNCLILAVCILSIKLADGSKELYGGVLLGLAFTAKIMSLPLMYHFLLRRMRLTAGAAIGCIAGLLLPAMVIGAGQTYKYTLYWILNIALHTGIHDHPAGIAGNASLYAVLARLFSSEPAFILNGQEYFLTITVLNDTVLRCLGIAVFVLMPGLLAVYAFLYRGRPVLVSYFGGLALAFCLAPVMMPVTERPHFLLLLPAYVYLTYIWIHLRVRNKLFYALVGAAFVLSTLTLRVWVGDLLGSLFWALGFPSMGALALAAAIFSAAKHVEEEI